MVWKVARTYLSPYGRLVRIENQIGSGTPDLFYTLRKISGWLELKLLPESGAVPDHFTREQLMWGQAEAAAGGRWHMLGRSGAAWVLYDAPRARRWFDGEANDPIFAVTGRFPLREVLDELAPLRAHTGLSNERMLDFMNHGP